MKEVNPLWNKQMSGWPFKYTVPCLGTIRIEIYLIFKPCNFCYSYNWESPSLYHWNLE